MNNLNFTQSHIDNLTEAVATGAKEYTYTDRTGAQQKAVMRPYDECVALLQLMDAHVNGGGRSFSVHATSKGLDS